MPRLKYLPFLFWWFLLITQNGAVLVTGFATQNDCTDMQTWLSGTVQPQISDLYYSACQDMPAYLGP